jgi:uncharacterized protein (DUF1810 family)
MDPFNLNRFLEAQEDSYAQALSEIQAGRKESHWIWYIFPQLAGLGYSHNAVYYGIRGVEEAQAYLEHPVLGPRLIEITRALLKHKNQDIEQMLGSIDALKLKSCMDLFASLPKSDSVFDEVIGQFYGK